MADKLGRVGVIVAARTGSKRLPGKILRPLGGIPMILFLLKRITASLHTDKIVLATTDLSSDDELATLVEAAGYPVFRGEQDDVVGRYVKAANLHGFDHVVRITGDCPFVDAESLDYCIKQACTEAPFDLATTKGIFPVGIDYEIYPASRMSELHNAGVLDIEDREHLTLHLYRHRKNYKLINLEPSAQWCSTHSYTIDTPEDYARGCALVDALGNCDFSIEDLVKTRL